MNAVKGRAAVVAGAGQGMGRATALLLAAEGAKVVVNDIAILKDQGNKRAADLVVEEIIAAGGEAVANYDDISTMEGGEKIIKQCVDTYGKIDILAIVAGIMNRKTFYEEQEEDWDRVMNVNVKGYFSLAHAAAPYMRDQGYGRIVMYSSKGAFGNGKSAVYSASKAAVMGFVAELGYELAPEGIKVNCIFPSAVTTLFPGSKEAYGGTPKPSPATPDMVAPMTVYLCSEKCTCTGEYFYIGGCDVGLYPRERKPLSLIRKGNEEKWTIEELNEMIPETFGWYLETKQAAASNKYAGTAAQAK